MAAERECRHVRGGRAAALLSVDRAGRSRRRGRRDRPAPRAAAAAIGACSACWPRCSSGQQGSGADQFLESLAEGYEHVVARADKKPDAVVRLTDIWTVLTLLPGQAKEYTRPEFARDLYLLDQSGARHYEDGRTLRWHASSGTRMAGVLTTVARTGQQQRVLGRVVHDQVAQ